LIIFKTPQILWLRSEFLKPNNLGGGGGGGGKKKEERRREEIFLPQNSFIKATTELYIPKVFKQKKSTNCEYANSDFG
jgi:hypothetical protein